MIRRTIVEPIRRISSQSRQISSSAAQIVNPSPGREELNVLVDNINDMMVRSNQLTEEVSRTRLKLMEAEVDRLKVQNMFLQAQINPHFLYNTLECICGMAAKEGNMKVREMTRLLGKLYRYCLEKPESTLGEELECVQTYDQILSGRYQEGYCIRPEVNEELFFLPVPRMILEPLVENAVQHGFIHGRKDMFTVVIRARMNENDLEIDIIDNGCGMDPLAMKKLNAQLGQKIQSERMTDGRIGILNVGTRLKLVYGEESGLWLEKNDMNGLTVHLRIRYSV